MQKNTHIKILLCYFANRIPNIFCLKIAVSKKHTEELQHQKYYYLYLNIQVNIDHSTYF